MNTFNRRRFLQLLGAASALAAFPPAIRAATAAPRVVVVGGGFAGATAAKYLKLWGDNIDVTLVEPNATHISCILSNLVLTGAIGMDRITLNYGSLRDKHGVRIVQDRAIAIDPAGHTLTLAGGERLPYDRLVLAPGIDFVSPPGWDAQQVPHAWQAGAQTTLLKNQLTAMPRRGTFVLTIPKAPYRCPPGPYERACMVADYVKRNKRGGRVIVLDANPGIIVEPHTFGTAFSQTYAGIVEYYPNTAVSEVDSANRIVHTTAGAFAASVLNLIPEQQAGTLVRAAGLATSAGGRWAPVDALSYASTVHPDIHVIGDSQATGQPKSGHMASSQAKVCADAILRAFAGLAPDPAPVTNSACYSPVTAKTASWLTAVFQYDAASRGMKLVPESFSEADRPTEDNYQQMFQWAANVFADSFG